MSASDLTAARIAQEMMKIYFEDEDAGRSRSLEEYKALFPGHEVTVERVYDMLQDRGGRSPAPRSLAVRGVEVGHRIGPYRLMEELGHGGQGTVFVAADTRMERKVALKVLGTRRASSSLEGLGRLRREAEVLARLNLPGICPVYEMATDADLPYIVMPYLEGETLAALIKRARASARSGRGPLLATTGDGESRPPSDSLAEDAAECARLVERVARALNTAHEAGVLHRDVKPGNIMVLPDREPVLLDFGLARDLNRDSISLTTTGQFLGTLPYMAPERLAGEAVEFDRRADVYALGVTLFECLAGSRPFRAPTQEGLVNAILSSPPADLGRLNPAVSRDLEVVVEKALEKDPRRRFQNAHELAEELRRIRERRPIRSRPAGPWLRLGRWAARNRGLAASLTAGFMILVAGLIAALILLGRIEREREQRTRELEEKRAALDEVTRLSDAKRLTELEQEAGLLWPDGRSRASQMEHWLERARRLLNRRVVHRDALAALDAGHPLPFARTDAVDETAAWYRERLGRLVKNLDRLDESIPLIERRLETTRRLERLTIDDQAAAWNECTTAIADTRSAPAYGGLALRPQLGLVPLGADPETGLHEFVVRRTGEAPARDPETGRLEVTVRSGLVLVLLPGGRISVPGDAASGTPEYEVVLAPFFLSKFEMTQAQFKRLTRKSPSFYRDDPMFPLELITWRQAELTMRSCGLTLPTEVQWEYACRAGTDTPWWTGGDPESLRGRERLKGDPPFAGDEAHVAVGSYPANPFGLHDMLGNVSEWCLDASVDLALRPRPGDGLRLFERTGSHMLRGGNYTIPRAAARADTRVAWRGTDAFIGLRPARPVEGGGEWKD